MDQFRNHPFDSDTPFNSSHPCYGLAFLDCPHSIRQSVWEYRPRLALNIILAALFGVCFIANLVQGIAWKTWGFMIAMSLGCIFEVIGYVGRIMAYNDLFTQTPFLIQICLLTFAPAFLSAGIYLCLSRIVFVFGQDISRIPAKWYTYIFITVDLISLILQSAGGAIASTDDTPELGTNIMLGGLGFQVFTLISFMVLCADYALRVYKRTKSGIQLDLVHSKLRESKRFRGFLVALGLSTTLILIRSIFRVIEMASGWNGGLMANEMLFFVLEGVMVVLAVIVLVVFHPGWCFADGYSVPKAALGKTTTPDRSTSEIELGRI